MNSILVIGTLVLASCGAAEYTTEEIPIPATATPVFFIKIVEFCSPEGGLNVTEVFSFITNVTEEGFIEQCHEHKAVWECITNITNLLNNQSNDNEDHDSVALNIYSGMGVLCNDPRVKPECVVEYTHSRDAISACEELHKSGINAQTTEGSLRACLQENVHYKCVENVLSKCDVGTFSVLAKHLELSAPSDCFNSEIVG